MRATLCWSAAGAALALFASPVTGPTAAAASSGDPGAAAAAAATASASGPIRYRSAPGEEPTGISTTASATATGACTARGALGGHQVRLHFSNPLSPCVPDALGTPGRDMNIHREVVRLVDAVPARERIDGHLYAATVPEIGAALRRAQDRGVRVKISGDGYLATSTDLIMADLNALHEHRWCLVGSARGCITSDPVGISHTKVFTFSATRAPDRVLHRDVSWFGSANKTIRGGAAQFNNAVTVYGDGTLHSGLTGYLDRLYALSPRTTDYYDPSSGRGYVRAPAASVYASPEAQTDLVVDRLDDVTPDSACRVRVMQAAVRATRMAVVRQLVRMKSGGCLVHVVASEVAAEPLQALKSAGIPVRRALVHDKAFVVHGKYGSTYRSRVYTGSHNLSGRANTTFDEIFVKLAPETSTSSPVYAAFLRHFRDAYDSAPAL